jgi:ribosomal-protein-alanine N-acetyltransferase
MQLHRREIDPLFDSFPVLNTERFVLRRMTLGDAPRLFEMLRDPHVARFTAHRPLRGMPEAVELVRNVGLDFATRRAVRWAVSHDPQGPLVATVGLHDWDRYHRVINVGFDVDREKWGQGIATEILSAVTQFTSDVLDVNRVQADVMTGNEGCMAVLERLGFEREGLQRERLYKDGTFHDVVLFAFRRAKGVPTH